MIGKVIRSLLDDSGALTALVPVAKMFPYVMNEDTAMPAIVYTIDSIRPEYNKDGWAGDECGFSVMSFSNDYANLQAIVAQVRAAMELERGTVEGAVLNHIYVTSMQEAYDVTADIFMNRMSFNVYITDY